MKFQRAYQKVRLIGGWLQSFHGGFICFIFAIFILTTSAEVHAQVKLSDRKSEAYRQSRKHRKGKVKRREKRYKKAQKRDLGAGEIELVPEMLKEKYAPKNQNIEKNPSLENYNNRKKQHRTFIRKARQGLDQGMRSGRSMKARIRGYKKQQRIIAHHQGNIRVRPYHMQDNVGMFPQPPVEQNPGLSNVREKNRKLAKYAQKAEEMSMQGMMSAPSKWWAKRQNMHQSRKIGLFQGNVKFNQRQREASYMAKSVQGLNQGMRKGPTQKERQQQSVSNSLTQSQYQGTRKAKTRRQKEIGYIEKSVQAQIQGMFRTNTKRQQDRLMKRNSVRIANDQGKLPGHESNKEGKYMAKSVEGLNQGLRKGVTRKEKQQQWISNSLVQSQFQGNIKNRSRKNLESSFIAKSKRNQTAGLTSAMNHRQKEAAYMAKSVELLDQGTIKGKSSRERQQQAMSSSLMQSQFQGTIPRMNKNSRESRYIRKSQQGLEQGLIRGKTRREMGQQQRSNSLVQSQFQGNLTRMTIPFRESQYIKKSHEALDQGLVSANTPRRKEGEYVGKSVEMLNQGLIKGKSKKQKESLYIRKSIEAQNSGLVLKSSRRKKESKYIEKSIEALHQGLVSRLTDRQKEAIYMGKSVELLNQGLYKGRNIQDKESMYIRKSIEALQAGLIKMPSRERQEARIKHVNGDITSYQGDIKQISLRRKEAEIRDATHEYQSFAGNVKIKKGFLQDWFFNGSQAKNLRLTGDFKVRSRLSDDIYYRRMSIKQKKFDGMEQESKFEQWWASIWKKPVDQKKRPEPLRKPRYDPKEHEIWNY